jgi:hypothetical protein
VDSTADGGRVPEQPARKALEAKDRLDEGRGKTGVGDVVGRKGESQEGGEGRRMTSQRYNVTPRMLENTWREIENRLDILRATNGAHIERY